MTSKLSIPTVAWAVAAVAAAALLVFVVIQVSGSDDPGAATDPPPPATTTGQPSAVIHPDRDQACAAVPQGPGTAEGKDVALADKLDLADDLLQTSSNVLAVGLGQCGDRWIVSVGVRNELAEVPATGPRGTPVVAYLQSPFYAY